MAQSSTEAGNYCCCTWSCQHSARRSTALHGTPTDFRGQLLQDQPSSATWLHRSPGTERMLMHWGAWRRTIRLSAAATLGAAKARNAVGATSASRGGACHTWRSGRTSRHVRKCMGWRRSTLAADHTLTSYLTCTLSLVEAWILPIASGSGTVTERRGVRAQTHARQRSSCRLHARSRPLSKLT